MKKIKEFIKKISNKKYCLLSLLLAGLLLFAVLGGLNGFKSAKNKVNAISAPATKNITLNGVTYSYNTSLKELKNSYGLFNFEYTRKFMTLWHTESEVSLTMDYYTGSKFDDDNVNVDSWLNLLNNNIYFLDNQNNKIESDFSSNIDTNNSTYITNIFDFGNNINDLQPLKDLPNNLVFNIKTLINNIDNVQGYENDRFNKDLFTGSCIVTFCYVPNDFTSNDNGEKKLHDNSIIYNYVMSRPIDYTFKIPREPNYELKMIYISFENQANIATENAIFGTVPKQYMTSETQFTQSGFITIDNVNFIENQNANMLTFNSDYNYGTMSNTYPYFKGNLLLSTNKYDFELLNYFKSNQFNPNLEPIMQSLPIDSYFGGKFGENKPIGQIYFNMWNSAFPYAIDNNVDYKKQLPKNGLFEYMGIISGNLQDFTISYKNQNQLLYVGGMSTLRTTHNDVEYSSLSAQIQDVLYNVGIVENTPEKEFEEKVQDDFLDLLKTTGLGAVIGILIGFLVGNPIGGLIVGAVIGFAVAIVPLLIDALQAIFGYDFLSGLYNFFNAITEFFVNLVDTIINFLLSIITNPFVLILIVIVAIIYIFVIRRNK